MTLSVGKTQHRLCWVKVIDYNTVLYL